MIVFLFSSTIDFLNYHSVIGIHSPVFVADLVYYGAAVDVYNFNNQRVAKRSTGFSASRAKDLPYASESSFQHELTASLPLVGRDRHSIGCRSNLNA